MARRGILVAGTILSIGLLGFSSSAAVDMPLQATRAENAPPSLVGTIRTSDGKPLEGVVVSARAANSTVTRSVFTDEAGEFFFPPLDGGQYQVWAQTTGFDAARAEVRLEPSRTVRHALTMKPLADIAFQLQGSEWLASMPNATKEQRRMREIFRYNCGLCHSTSVILQQRFDEAGWGAIVDFMIARHLTGTPRQIGMNRTSTVVHHKAEIAKYLASVRGPNSPPLKYVVHPRPKGEAARVLVTTYDMPFANRADGLSPFNAFDWQLGAGTHGAFPGAVHDVVVDPSGNAWLNSIDVGLGRLAVKLNPETGQSKVYTVPGAVGGGRIYIDPKGENLWLPVRLSTQADESLGRIELATEKFEAYVLPAGMSVGLRGSSQMAPDALGKVWMSTQFGIIRFDPDTKKFRLFTDATLHDGFTYGVAADRRGNGWMAKYAADKIGFADAKTGKTYEIDMRPPWLKDDEDLLTAADKEAYEAMGVGTWGGINMVPGRQAPRRMNYDAKTDKVWVANNNGDTVVSIDAATRVPKYYRVPRPAGPYRVDVDNDSNAYVSLLLDDALLKLNPTTGEWTTYEMPTRGCETRSIFVDRRRTEVWLPCDRAARVMRVQFRTPAQLQALKVASAAVAR